ncbi:MAG: hypothetical protein ACFFE1_04740 [Candidatus Thorarchaeota archaeon]
MGEERSLDELPDQVYVALGRRGMQPIPLKECTYECEGKEITLIKPPKNRYIPSEGEHEVVEDWLVACTTCNREFTIRLKIHYLNEERLETRVNLIDDNEKDLGWLGSF